MHRVVVGYFFYEGGFLFLLAVVGGEDGWALEFWLLYCGGLVFRLQKLIFGLLDKSAVDAL